MKRLILFVSILFAISVQTPAPIIQRPVFTIAAAAGGGTPTFGQEIITRLDSSATEADTTLTLTTAVSAGEHIIVPIQWYSSSVTLSSITDAGGNTYTKDKEALALTSASGNVGIWSAHAATGLSIGQTIVLHWSTSAGIFRAGPVFKASGIASSSYVDQTASATANSSTVTAAASTTAANTLLVGAVFLETEARTLDATAWTISGGLQNWASGSFRSYYLYHNETASGSKDPNGTLSASFTWGCVWVAYK